MFNTSLQEQINRFFVSTPLNVLPICLNVRACTKKLLITLISGSYYKKNVAQTTYMSNVHDFFVLIGYLLYISCVSSNLHCLVTLF